MQRLSYRPRQYRLFFPQAHVERNHQWAERGVLHPSWRSGATVGEPRRFGGRGTSTCMICGDVLQATLLLDDCPPGLAVAPGDCVDFVTCLSCVGWEAQVLFFRHGADGVARALSILPLASEDTFPSPFTREFRASPFTETEVLLVPERVAIVSDEPSTTLSVPNRNRLGGEPAWIYEPEPPVCPGCATEMPFILQVSHDLPTERYVVPGPWAHGDGYFFWCASCRISANLGQSA